MPWKCNSCGSMSIRTHSPGEVADVNRLYLFNGKEIEIAEQEVDSSTGPLEEEPVECNECHDASGFTEVTWEGEEFK